MSNFDPVVMLNRDVVEDYFRLNRRNTNMEEVGSTFSEVMKEEFESETPAEGGVTNKTKITSQDVKYEPGTSVLSEGDLLPSRNAYVTDLVVTVKEEKEELSNVTLDLVENFHWLAEKQDSHFLVKHEKIKTENNDAGEPVCEAEASVLPEDDLQKPHIPNLLVEKKTEREESKLITHELVGCLHSLENQEPQFSIESGNIKHENDCVEQLEVYFDNNVLDAQNKNNYDSRYDMSKKLEEVIDLKEEAGMSGLSENTSYPSKNLEASDLAIKVETEKEFRAITHELVIGNFYSPAKNQESQFLGKHESIKNENCTVESDCFDDNLLDVPGFNGSTAGESNENEPDKIFTNNDSGTGKLEAVSGRLDETIELGEITPPDVKCEVQTTGLPEDDYLPTWEEPNISDLMAEEIKIEQEEELSEVTNELVGYFHSFRPNGDTQFSVKHENNYDGEPEIRFDNNASSVSVEDALTDNFNDDAFKISSIQFKKDRDSNTKELGNDSGTLEDLFPESLGELEEHSNKCLHTSTLVQGFGSIVGRQTKNHLTQKISQSFDSNAASGSGSNIEACKRNPHTVKHKKSSAVKQHSSMCNDEKPFQCKKCLLKFKLRGYLTTHMTRTHSSERPFCCNECGKMFKYKNNLKGHLLTHSNERPLKCNQCPADFKHIESLKKHFLLHCNKRVLFDCNDCSKKFQTKLGLKRHIVLHSSTYNDERLFQCTQCLKKFKERNHLNRHMMVHSNERPFKCSQCPAAFKVKKALTNHLHVHSERVFECNYCSKKFKTKLAIKAHIIIHSDERPYECVQCRKNFKTREHLKSHLHLHSEKSLKCTHCPSKFRTNTALRQHLKVQSMVRCTEKRFKCEVCTVKFLTLGNLKNHLRVHSNEKPFVCELCSAKFKSKVGLQNHSMVHSNETPFKCDLCPAEFKRKFTLQEHSKVHTNERPFKCALCPAKFKTNFALKHHLKVHSRGKPFKCAFCSAEFKRKFTLKQHLTVHKSEKRFECGICSTKFERKRVLRNHLKVHSVEDVIKSTLPCPN